MLWPILVVGIQVFVGAACLTFVQPQTLRQWPRAWKLALAFLMGTCIPTLTLLILLQLGFRFAPWLWGVFGMVALCILFVRRRDLSALWTEPSQKHASPSPLQRYVLNIGLAALFAWNVVSAICLPTTDYDGLVIWTYRDRVLLREETLYTPNLRDPERIAPMKRHPYFLPVLEASYCAWTGFRFSLAHMPHLTFYLIYILLVSGSARLLRSGALAHALLAALLLMPAMSVQFWLEGPREPVIGILTLAATGFLVLWIERQSLAPLLLGGILVSAAHQTKIEGTAVAAGYFLAALLYSLAVGHERKKHLSATILVFILAVFVAVPWEIFKSQIPHTSQEYRFTEGFGTGWKERLPYVLPVAWMTGSEVFFRPELYGFAPMVLLAALVLLVRHRPPFRWFLACLPAVVCLAGIVAIYLVRQTQLEAIRNLTFSRRFVCVLPALIFGVLTALDRGMNPLSSGEKSRCSEKL